MTTGLIGNSRCCFCASASADRAHWAHARPSGDGGRDRPRRQRPPAPPRVRGGARAARDERGRRAPAPAPRRSRRGSVRRRGGGCGFGGADAARGGGSRAPTHGVDEEASAQGGGEGGEEGDEEPDGRGQGATRRGGDGDAKRCRAPVGSGRGATGRRVGVGGGVVVSDAFERVGVLLLLLAVILRRRQPPGGGRCSPGGGDRPHLTPDPRWHRAAPRVRDGAAERRV